VENFYLVQQASLLEARPRQKILEVWTFPSSPQVNRCSRIMVLRRLRIRKRAGTTADFVAWLHSDGAKMKDPSGGTTGRVKL
jgi:hypothetical protein